MKELHYRNLSLQEIEGEYFLEIPINKQYLASNYGRIKSKEQVVTHNYGGKAVKKARILKQAKNNKGYLGVGLTENGKTKSYRVSRLIAITFIPNPENKPQVNHINGIKDDNRAENIEWNTSGENVRHAWDNGLAKKQYSYLKIQQRLSSINPYLCHDINVVTPIGKGRVVIDQSCYRVEYENGRIENLIKSLRFWKDEFKLVLRNLSDLTKEIEHNGEKFVPILEYEGRYIGDRIEECIYASISDLKFAQWHVIEQLLEWHFDIFGLLEKNLAIDINTLKNEI